MSIWSNPTIIDSSVIVHVASENDGLGWCVEMLGLSSSGQLVATSYDNTEISVAGPIVPMNSWTHAAITYNISNGLRLYVNGSRFAIPVVPFHISPAKFGTIYFWVIVSMVPTVLVAMVNMSLLLMNFGYIQEN